MASLIFERESQKDDDDEIRKQEEESFSCAMKLAGSSVLPLSMQSAIDLGVFDIIDKEGPNAKLSSSQIAAKIGTKNSEAPMMLDRILRFLASHSVIDCSVVAAANDDYGTNLVRLYSLNQVSKHFATNEDGVSLGPLKTLSQDEAFLAAWSGLKDAIVEGGIPFNRVRGMHYFEFADLNPRFNQMFNKAMFNQSTIVMKKILHVYKGFEHLTQLVDVGGGLGATLNLITSKYPQIKGVNFDLPHVIKHAPSYPGVEHVGGDMFRSVPTGEAIILKYILHDWNDENCLKLLKNCYKALPHDGKVIVVEQILPAKPDATTSVQIATQMDVLMLTLIAGGKERSREEFMALATGAGFSGIRFECFVCNFWVMEFFKSTAGI